MSAPSSIVTDGTAFVFHGVQYKYPVSRNGQDPAFILDELSLTAPKGHIISVLGSNGSGKSTLGKLLAGLISPTKGCITLGNATPGSQSARWQIGYVPQELTLDHDQKGSELLELFCQLENVSIGSPHVAHLIKEFKLASHLANPVRMCSGGTKRKLQLVLALLKTPELLIIDEGLQQLDVESKEVFWAIAHHRSRVKQTTILISHDWDESELKSDDILLLHKGHIIGKNSPSELVATLGHWRWKAKFLSPCPHPEALREILKKSDDFRIIALDHMGVDIEMRPAYVPDDKTLLTLFQSKGLILTSYQRCRPNLLSAYEHLTGASRQPDNKPQRNRRHD